MISHFIIVEDADTYTSTEDAQPTGFYGPYPTKGAAEEVLAHHPRAPRMHIVGLDRLARIYDPCAHHPNSAGV